MLTRPLSIRLPRRRSRVMSQLPPPPGERSSVILPGHVSAGERARLHTRGCIPVGERVRVPEPPLVRLSVSHPGLAHVQGPDAGAGHVSTGMAPPSTPVFGTSNFGTCNFGTARIHVGEHSIIRIGTRVWIAAPGEKGQHVALGARRHLPGSRCSRHGGPRHPQPCGRLLTVVPLCYLRVMAVREKRSISIPPEFDAEIAAAAQAAGMSYSGWIAQTARKEFIIRAGLEAVSQYEAEYCPFTPDEIAGADEWATTVTRPSGADRVTGVTYDSGALIAAERGERLMWARHRALLLRRVVPAVPSPVVAQCWRGAPRQAQLARLLAGCEVETLDDTRARATGTLAGRARTSNIVAAIVP